jgi:hypothetical protein
MANKNVIKSLNQLFEENHGKTVLMGGRKYRVQYQGISAIFPYPHYEEHLSLVPVNTNAKWYREMRNRLGDDWVVDAKHLDDKDFAEVYRQLAWKEKPRGRKPGTSARKKVPGRKR